MENIPPKLKKISEKKKNNLHYIHFLLKRLLINGLTYV